MAPPFQKKNLHAIFNHSAGDLSCVVSSTYRPSSKVAWNCVYPMQCGIRYSEYNVFTTPMGVPLIFYLFSVCRPFWGRRRGRKLNRREKRFICCLSKEGIVVS